MDSHEVKITFRGICAHFFNPAPGIPHRVVLPQADGVRIGFIDVGGKITHYCLPPHLCYVYSPNQPPIEGPAIALGWIIGGVHLRIANPIGVGNIDHFGILEEGLVETLPHLPDFDSNYRYSNDVVLGGRARCYFDLPPGILRVSREGAALHGQAVIATAGPPRLRIEPFGGAPMEVPIGSELIVGNTSLGWKDASVDFLLHLLTAERGIPEVLPREPYGFDANRALPPREKLMERLGELLDLGYPGNLTKSAEEVFFGMYETDPSCSNSQWP